MPLTRITARVPEHHPSREREEEEPRPKRPRLEPVEAQPMGPLPYRDFVEREAREYWQSLGGVGSLTKPAQEKIRATAMPILGAALRRRTGWSPWTMAHHAVGGMIQHALETGGIKSPFSEASESPNYVEALIQLADNANWLAREIPLPDHPPPHHPPIYYTMDPESSRPMPRDDSYIRGDYVYTPWFRSRITRFDRIYPWILECYNPDIIAISLNFIGIDACFTLQFGPENIEVVIFWLESIGPYYFLHRIPLKDLHFSPHPPPR